MTHDDAVHDSVLVVVCTVQNLVPVVVDVDVCAAASNSV